MGFELQEQAAGRVAEISWDPWEYDRLAQYRKQGPELPRLDEFHQVIPWRVWTRNRRIRRRRRVAVAGLAILGTAVTAAILLGWPI